MDIVRITETEAGGVVPLLASFRVALRAYKGITSEMDMKAAEEETLDFIRSGCPVYAAREDGRFVGYMVLRIDGGLTWVEQIYVSPFYRRRGAASLLFEKAEEVSRAMGEDTVFNFVHPNNTGMIAFLRSKGYTVLNLIEIRKPFKGETLHTTVRVDDQVFDY